MLTIIPTPIGNLADITLRATDALKNCDGIICEDTRRTSILLNHYQIPKKHLIVLNDYNEVKVFPLIISHLRGGSNLALVSDAGTPLISDPGYKLVRECLKEDLPVDSIPGPCSVILALTLSGLPLDKFLFLGYPPDKEGNRKKLWLQSIAIATHCNLTFILFVSPFKLKKTLDEMKEVLGDIEITLAKELTKIHQKVKSNLISTWIEELNPPAGGPKGEYILLFSSSSLSTSSPKIEHESGTNE